MEDKPKHHDRGKYLDMLLHNILELKMEGGLEKVGDTVHPLKSELTFATCCQRVSCLVLEVSWVFEALLPCCLTLS